MMKTKIMSMLAFVVSAFTLLSCSSYARSYSYDNNDYIYRTASGNNYVNRNVTVEAENPDISYNLDLRAVANAFADSRNLEEFERQINDYDSGINNLDLNFDGQVDYLRVIETSKGNTHLVVLQAVVGYDTYQDVASIVVEKRNNQTHYVQIVGDPYIYGPYYIIEPVYVYSPPIFSFFWGAHYARWYSPYYWGYYPSYWHHWHPRPVNVYVNNINIYVDNSRNTYNYSNRIRSNQYNELRKGVSRNDYQRANPDRSFSSRNASRTDISNRRDLGNYNNTSGTRNTGANPSTTRNTGVNSSTNRSGTTRTAVTNEGRSRNTESGVRTNNTPTRTSTNVTRSSGAVRNAQEWNNTRSTNNNSSTGNTRSETNTNNRNSTTNQNNSVRSTSTDDQSATSRPTSATTTRSGTSNTERNSSVSGNNSSNSRQSSSVSTRNNTGSSTSTSTGNSNTRSSSSVSSSRSSSDNNRSSGTSSGSSSSSRSSSSGRSSGSNSSRR